MALDRKKLAVIHIVKKELGLSDDEYRDLLERETVLWSRNRAGMSTISRIFSAGITTKNIRNNSTKKRYAVTGIPSYLQNKKENGARAVAGSGPCPRRGPGCGAGRCGRGW